MLLSCCRRKEIQEFQEYLRFWAFQLFGKSVGHVRVMSGSFQDQIRVLLGSFLGQVIVNLAFIQGQILSITVVCISNFTPSVAKQVRFAVGWDKIKISLMAQLKGLTAKFKLM